MQFQTSQWVMVKENTFGGFFCLFHVTIEKVFLENVKINKTQNSLFLKFVAKVILG